MLPKVYAHGCKPQSKSKQLFVFFQNAHTERLMPSAKYLLTWFVSGSLKHHAVQRAAATAPNAPLINTFWTISFQCKNQEQKI